MWGERIKIGRDNIITYKDIKIKAAMKLYAQQYSNKAYVSLPVSINSSDNSVY